jgi:hypothetical protein
LYSSNGASSSYHTAVGAQSLHNTTNAQYNTAVGYNAGATYDLGSNNTLIGANNDVLGAGYFNCIALGEAVTCTASSQARIGNSSTSQIGGFVGWTTFPSDRRFKKDINENLKCLEFIMKLRPVTYHVDVSAISKQLNEGRGHEMNESSLKAIAEKEEILYSGFVAQEVERAAKEVGYDFSGVDKPKHENDLYGIRYAEFVVPLVKAMQEQQQMINDLKKQNEILTKELLELKAIIQSKK